MPIIEDIGAEGDAQPVKAIEEEDDDVSVKTKPA